MMTLDEAIRHSEHVAENGMVCKECAEQHRQLAGWLKELRAYRDNRGISIEDFEEAIDILQDREGKG